ncbi:MAG: ABC transporter permease [Bacilli bacterium]|nr:ABC transporter permease [Bacilli bacterium]
MNHKLLQFSIGVAFVILVWQAVIFFGDFNEALFPGPITVFGALVELIKDGTLFVHIKDSMRRFAIGYVLAGALAIVLGLLLGRSRWIWPIVDPVVQLLRPISPVAWSPFIVLTFGIGDLPAIVIIFIAAFFPILLTTIKGVKNIDPQHLKLASNLQFNKFDVYRKIIIPAALPSIMNGLHLALGTAWIFLVAGEMVGSQSGLGYLIVDARNMLHLPNVLAGIVVIGIIGLLLDRLITVVQTGLKKASRIHF